MPADPVRTRLSIYSVSNTIHSIPRIHMAGMQENRMHVTLTNRFEDNLFGFIQCWEKEREGRFIEVILGLILR